MPNGRERAPGAAPVPLRNAAALLPEPLRALEDRMGAHTTLERVLAWAAAERPPRRIAGIVTQDEFTHDVLVPIEAPLWLVYDIT